MEYYWGYAAANAPIPNVYHSRSRPTPVRSQSTKVAPTTRRSRIPGHRRTTSSDSSRSHSSHEITAPHHLDLPAAATSPPPPTSPFSGPPASPLSPTGASTPASPDRDVAFRDRMSASVRYQNKQLPATPRLDTTHEATKYNHASGHPANKGRTGSTANSAVSPGGATLSAVPLTPASPSTSSTTTVSLASSKLSSSTAAADRKNSHHAPMFVEPSALSKISGMSFGRTESVSSTSGTTLSTRTMVSSEPPQSADSTSTSSHHHSRPFMTRNGRTYLADPSLAYPLPVDLAELHRQSLRTLLLFQLFGGPVCSPAFANKPPTRVLEVACGSGFWSMMCHRYYARHGHSSISFTGMDIASIGCGISPGASSSSSSDNKPDKDMKWRFVQHDLRQTPFPFQDEEFDLIMVKDVSLASTLNMHQQLTDEYIRILRPGGTLEIWESDATIRMLRPHVPDLASGTDDEEEREAAETLGAYIMTANTPLSAPLNNFVVEYNAWLSKALEARSLSPVPCTLIGPSLLQESDTLMGISSRRLAVPLSEVKWEREGVGGVVTKDGKTYVETRGKIRDAEQNRKALTAGQSALRRTALLTFVQLIQSMEPLLRDVSGKSQDEWDGWAGKMMNDLMNENGTSWGECLEVGAWWARKRK